MMVSIGAESEGMACVERELDGLKGVLQQKERETQKKPLLLERKNEGFLDASQVQYVSRAGNFRKAGYVYTGALRILKVLLSYDYLWIHHVLLAENFFRQVFQRLA